VQSAIYKGDVWHRRHSPRPHRFNYHVFMMYLDLSEVDQVLSLSRFWSYRRWSLARFNRSDFYQPQKTNSQSSADGVAGLDRAVRKAVENELHFYPEGPVRLLTNLRYFGYLINPISCYYCFSAAAQGEKLQALMLEVTNTPWGQKTQYVLDMRDLSPNEPIEFNKAMHVSPFMPMAMNYRWCGKIPAEKLQYTLSNYTIGNGVDESPNRKIFDAGVNFNRVELTASNLNKMIFRYPFMTMQIAIAIYWQALKLALKGVNFLPHPAKGQKE